MTEIASLPHRGRNRPRAFGGTTKRQFPHETDATLLTTDDFGLMSETSAGLLSAVLSVFVGSQKGTRAATEPLLKTLASIANTPPEDSTTDEEHDSTFPANVPLSGWPQGAAIFRGPLAGTSPKALSNDWLRLRAQRGIKATLPLQTLVLFFPSRSWRLLEAAIMLGPHALIAQLERHFFLAAVGAAPGNNVLSASPVDARIKASWKFMELLHELATKGFPSSLLDAWKEPLPPRPRASAFGAKPARRDRKAPQSDAIRRFLHDADAQIARREQLAPSRQELHGFQLLRDRAMVETFCCLGGRVSALAPLLRRHIELDHRFLDGTRGAAIQTQEVKGDLPARWKAVAVDCAMHILDYMDAADLTDLDDPVWAGGWAYVDRLTGERLRQNDWERGEAERIAAGAMSPVSISRRIGDVLLPYTEGKRRSAHTLRHLAHQLAKKAARLHLEAQPNTPAQIDEEVIARSLVDHAMPNWISAVYDDIETEESRERWAAVGSRGIWALIRSPQHSINTGLDHELIVRRLQGLQETESRLAAAADESDRLEDQLKAIASGNHATCKAMPEIESKVDSTLAAAEARPLGAAEFQEFVITHERLNRDIRRLQHELTLEERRLARELIAATELQGTERLRRAEAERALEAATQVRLPLPDDGGAAPDVESELRDLLAGKMSLDAADLEESVPPPVRDRLSTTEMADCLGVPKSTLDRWIRVALKSDTGLVFAEGDRRNPWTQPIETILEVLSARQRWFVFSRLDLSGFSPSQIQAMRQKLARPPLGTSFGG
jgi:hypothetical protein